MTSELTYEVLFSWSKEYKKTMQRFDPCLKASSSPFVYIPIAKWPTISVDCDTAYSLRHVKFYEDSKYVLGYGLSRLVSEIKGV